MRLLEDEMECINNFMTHRRRSIIQSLAEAGELSQKALAEKEGCVPSTLSSALKKIENFKPKLIEMNMKGRFKMYRLTEAGRAYWDTTNNISSQEIEIDKVDLSSRNNEVEKENVFLLLKEFKDKYNERWEYILDTNLFRYEYMKSVVDSRVAGESEEKKDDGLTMTDNFLEGLKTLLNSSGRKAYEDFISLNLENPILIERIKSILSCFVEIQSLEELTMSDIKCNIVYDLLDAMFGESEYKSAYADIGLQYDDYCEMGFRMKKIAKVETGKTKTMIQENLRKQFQISNNFAFILAERVDRYINSSNLL